MTPDRIDLETLMAYADDALAPEDAARVARHLEHDPAARAQVEQMRRSAALARAALDADLAQPVPPALQRSVEQAIAAARAKRQAEASADHVPPGRLAEPSAEPPADRPEGRSSGHPSGNAPGHSTGRSTGSAARPPQGAPRRGWLAALGLDLQPRFAFAASAATLAAGVIGYMVGTAAPGPAQIAQVGLLVASADESAALTRTLNAAASGQRRTLPDGAQVELVASFKTGAGDLCREFKWTRGDEPGYLAVACRDARQWTINVAARTAPGDAFVPAASPTAAVDAFISAAGGGAPLSREDEARALAAR